MSAHTQGPWSVGPQVDFHQVVKAAGTTLAAVYSGIPAGEANRTKADREERRLANARLIAAAPDMLKALDELLCAWNDGDMDTDAMFDAIHRAREVYRAAHAEVVTE